MSHKIYSVNEFICAKFPEHNMADDALSGIGKPDIVGRRPEHGGLPKKHLLLILESTAGLTQLGMRSLETSSLANMVIGVAAKGTLTNDDVWQMLQDLGADSYCIDLNVLQANDLENARQLLAASIEPYGTGKAVPMQRVSVKT